jgi:hypothetical protein
MKCPNCKEQLNDANVYFYCGNLQCNYIFRVYNLNTLDLQINIKNDKLCLIFYNRYSDVDVFLRSIPINEKISTITNFVLDSDFKNLFNLIKKYEESMIFI